MNDEQVASRAAKGPAIQELGLDRIRESTSNPRQIFDEVQLRELAAIVECGQRIREQDEIGIPDVPAIVWCEEQHIARERLDAGRCPKHNIPLIETDTQEYCQACDAERHESHEVPW